MTHFVVIIMYKYTQSIKITLTWREKGEEKCYLSTWNLAHTTRMILNKLNNLSLKITEYF